MTRPRGAARLGLLALAAFAAGAANAQELTPGPAPIRGRASQFLTELTSRLNLSSEQQARLDRIKKEFLTKHRDELRQLRQDARRVQQAVRQARQNKNGLALADVRARARDLRRSAQKLQAEFERQLLAILTDAQKQQYRAFRKELTSPPKRVTR